MTGPQPVNDVVQSLGLTPTGPQTPAPPSVTDLQQAIQSGKYVPAGNTPINMIGPDGKAVSFNPTDVKYALDNGYRLENAYEGAVNNFVDQNGGLLGALRVGTSQFANQALGGVPDVLNNLGTNQLANDQQTALKAAHPLANVVGGGLGVAADIGLLGGAAEGAGQLATRGATSALGDAASTLAGKAVTSAAKLGAQSAVFAAPRTTAQAILGDPESAAESLVAQIGIGALLGFGTPLAGRLIKAGQSLAADGVQGMVNKLDDWNSQLAGREMEAIGDNIPADTSPPGLFAQPQQPGSDPLRSGLLAMSAAKYLHIPLVGPAVAAIKTAQAVSSKLTSQNVGKVINLIEDSANVAGKMMNSIPDVVDDMASRVGTTPSILASKAIPMLFGPKYKEDDDANHLTNLSQALGDFTTDPDAASDRVASMTAPIGHINPALQEALTNKLLNTISYVQSIIPKAPMPDNPLSSVKWQPSQAQLATFNSQMAVIVNPNVTLQHLQNGSLTIPEIQTLQTVYPALYQHMQQRLMTSLIDKQVTLPYGARVKVGLFLNTMSDQSLQPASIRNLQAIYQQQPSSAPKPSSNGAKNVNCPAIDDPTSTDRERVAINQSFN